MLKKLANIITGKFMLENLEHTNSSFKQDTIDESAYVEKDFDCAFMTLEESRALKIRMLEDGLDLNEMFKDSNIFFAYDKFDKTASDYNQADIDKFEKPIAKRSDLQAKLESGEKLASHNSFTRSKKEIK